MWFDYKGKVVISMPGVPHEMKGLMSGEILSSLQKRFNAPYIRHQMIRTIGIGESDLAPIIDSWAEDLPSHIKLAYLPRVGQVRLRLTGHGNNEQALLKDLHAQTVKLNSIIPEYIFDVGNSELNLTVANMLTEQRKTVATAESCTGGYLGHLLTEYAGSSKFFLGGLIPYSNKIKEAHLRVPSEILRKYGAVSEETVIVMAESIKKQFGSTYGLSTSGIAGPGGGTPEKPVGTIWIALAGPRGVKTQLLQLKKDRTNNIYQTTQSVLELLRQDLLKNN
jgi:nicotinamide-nucleotide amidase